MFLIWENWSTKLLELALCYNLSSQLLLAVFAIEMRQFCIYSKKLKMDINKHQEYMHIYPTALASLIDQTKCSKNSTTLERYCGNR